MAHPTDDLFVHIYEAQRKRWGAGHREEGAGRQETQRMVIQRTTSGIGLLHTSRGSAAVPGGYAMLYCPCELIALECHSSSQVPYEEEHLSFTAPLLKRFFETLRCQYGSVLRMAMQGESASIFGQIFRSSMEGALTDPFELSAQMHRLILALFREQEAAQSLHSDPIEVGYQYIRTQYVFPIDIREVARLAGLNYRYFIGAFAKKYGRTPGAFLTAVRLESSKTMLERTRVPIKEVAARCGFNGSKSLCQAFRRHFGATPGEWRASGTRTDMLCALEAKAAKGKRPKTRPRPRAK